MILKCVYGVSEFYLVFMLLANILGYRISNRVMWNRWASIKWCFKFSADFTFMLLSLCFFNFFCALLTDKNWNIRFKWMRYLWQTQDAYMNGLGFEGIGKGGDRGFYEQWNPWYEKYPSYWRRVYVAWRWITRNCSNGFSTNVIGLDRSKIIIEKQFVSSDGRRTRILAYKKMPDGSKGKLVGYETRDYGFFFGRGKMRVGFKLDQSETYYPAMLVGRWLPFKNPN